MPTHPELIVGCLVAGLLVCMPGCDRDAHPQAAPVVTEVVAKDAETASPEDARCRLATADAMGPDDCPAQGDGDHDGIDDGIDSCPDTTPGIEVDASGCALASTTAEPEPG